MQRLGTSRDLVYRLGYLAKYDRGALVELLARSVAVDLLREALEQQQQASGSGRVEP